jgi:hypothetical protein
LTKEIIITGRYGMACRDVMINHLERGFLGVIECAFFSSLDLMVCIHSSNGIASDGEKIAAEILEAFIIIRAYQDAEQQKSADRVEKKEVEQ